VTAGAKVVAMTLIDFLTRPELMVQAKDYFESVQMKETEYKPMITENDPPPIELNTAIMERFRPEMEKYYFDETKYDTYLEQLGVDYPTVREE
jgi:aminobenzoyl-glutamate utilization protein B